MKMITATVAGFATAVTTSSIAQETTGGHYEWKVRHLLGPITSGAAKHLRVWVKDKTPQTANCDWDLMNADGFDCVKARQGQQMAPAKG